MALQTPRDNIRLFQHILNEFSWDYPGGRVALKDDGIIGSKTLALWNRIQKTRGYVITNEFVGELLEDAKAYALKKFLTKDQMLARIREVGLDPAMVFSVMSNESMGRGFFPNTRAKVLFERHKFYIYLQQRVPANEFKSLQREYPNLITRDAGGYQYLERDWERLDLAMRINLEAAILSASWGLGQIMGFNHKIVGEPDLMQFFIKNQTSEAEQFELFLNYFVLQPNLFRAANRKDFETVATLYNGSGHARNRYVPRLKDAYTKQVELLKGK